MYNIKIILFTKEDALNFQDIIYYRVREGFFHIVKKNGNELYFNINTVAFFDVSRAEDVDTDS